MADAMTVLRQEITNLEKELTKRRQALSVLTGSSTPVKTNTAAKTASSPKPSASPPLGERIMTYLTTNKGKLFVPAQIADELAKADKNVKRENVQRRLGELFKRKRVKRENGSYGVA